MGGEPKTSRATPGNDNRNDAPLPHPTGTGGLKSDFIMAVRFYSLLPISGAPHEKPDINRIARAVPFASVIIGLLPALALFLAAFLQLSALFSALLCVGVGAVVTGAMAEDAIGDSMDGLGGRTPERRLEILRDSRIGAYGVIGITLFIGLKASALMQLLGARGFGAVLLFLAAQVIARSAALWLIHALPSARGDGMSASAGALERTPMLVGFLFAGLIGFVLAAPFVGVLGVALALVFAALVSVGWTALWRRLVGGQTGDLIGGLQAVLEIAILTAFILF
jgi:adenosylcobinamide-GDP ribazoletransferase